MAEKMITKQKFTVAVKDEINLIAIGSVKAHVQECILYNGERTDTIAVMLPGVYGINVKMDSMYEKFTVSGGNIRFISKSAELILDAFYRSAGQTLGAGRKIQDAKNYGVAREMLTARLINGKMNPEKIANHPHMPWMDLEAILYLAIDDTEDSLMSAAVPNSMFEGWGVSLEEVFKDALANMREKDPVKLVPISKVLGESTGVPEGARLPSTKDHSGLIVLTNRSKINGATAVLQPGVLEMCAEAVGGDFCIIPSSIHEVLISSEVTRNNRQEIKSMIQSVNLNEVAPEDVLSDHPYFYSVKTKEITM